MALETSFDDIYLSNAFTEMQWDTKSSTQPWHVLHIHVFETVVCWTFVKHLFQRCFLHVFQEMQIQLKPNFVEEFFFVGF